MGISPDPTENAKPPLKRRQTKVKPKSAKDSNKPKSPKLTERQLQKDEEATTKNNIDRPQSSAESKSRATTPNSTTTEKRPNLSRKKSSLIEKEKMETDLKNALRRPSVQANLKGILKKFESTIQKGMVMCCYI